jgi:hypothetical protein
MFFYQTTPAIRRRPSGIPAHLGLALERTAYRDVIRSSQMRRPSQVVDVRRLVAPARLPAGHLRNSAAD